MAQAAVPLMIASTVMSAGNQLAAGRAESKALNFQAQQAERNAVAEQAGAQRVAIEQRRKSDLLQSRAVAVAAASGAGADDVTVNDILLDMDAEGDYNVLASLFEGDERAAANRMYASARRFEGKEVRRAAGSKALNTIMSGASSLSGRFGAGASSPTMPLQAGMTLSAPDSYTGLPWQRDRNLPWLR